MKKIKLNFVCFYSGFNKDDNLIINSLRKHFDVEITENPDFLICSNIPGKGQSEFEYMKYDCVRIMFIGENISPDFTAFDYVIGCDFIEFGDRYLRYPLCFFSRHHIDYKVLSFDEAKSKLKQKEYFCNFIYGHQSASMIRESLFKKLSEYKTVVSPGGFYNNTGKNGCTQDEKFQYVKRSKFTIACDSISYPGFTTEKITDSFLNYSIPIYAGSCRINEDFNENAFVWVKSNSDKDINEAVEKIIYLDNNDDAYLKMLMTNPYLSERDRKDRFQKFEKFLFDIFNQPPEMAKRRISSFAADNHNNNLKELAAFQTKKSYKLYKDFKDFFGLFNK